MNNKTVSAACECGNHNDEDYAQFLQRVQLRLEQRMKDNCSALFTTDVDGLWDVYLGGFKDEHVRQHHNCHECRHFIERYGSLAVISPDGIVTSALWDGTDADERNHDALNAMSKAVRRSKVTGVFVSDSALCGTPKTGVWSHLNVQVPPSSIWRGIIDASQRMAQQRENFKNVIAALGVFKREHIETALSLLRNDSLYRSEHVLGQVEWLSALHVAMDSATKTRKENVVWRAVATAPNGFCHPRSSVVGSLLEDIADGKDFAEVSRAFAAKMHPLSYQRPQAAPAASTIAQAEKIVQALGIEKSLERRFARMDDIRSLWMPKQDVRSTVKSGGAFSNLKTSTKHVSVLAAPPVTMTWDKFSKTVLPTAERIELCAPMKGHYLALVTAVHADAPPVLQWDNETNRNPVSWYFWHGGSYAAQFGLSADKFVNVNAVTLKPSMWCAGCERHGTGVMFVLEGARESKQQGSALFPECLRAELHGVRSVIEAHSKQSSIAGINEPHVAGIMLTGESKQWDTVLRVTVNGRATVYKLDRWD